MAMRHLEVTSEIGEYLKCEFREEGQIGNSSPTCLLRNLLQRNSIDLNNRSRVYTSSPEIIVAHTKCDYRHGDKGSVIHVFSRDRQL